MEAMVYVIWALTALCSYFLGGFNGAIVISKYVFKNDIRKHGSGNAGLTNFFRTFGGPWTLVMLLSDVVKIVVAVLVCRFSLEPFGFGTEAAYWAAFFGMLGHVFPCFFGFKGGKGVLSLAAGVAMIDLRAFFILIGLFAVIVLLTRWVSLGSIIAGALVPVAVWLVVGASPFCIVLSAMCSGLLIFMHRANIVRLVRGEERRFQFSRKKEG